MKCKWSCESGLHRTVGSLRGDDGAAWGPLTVSTVLFDGGSWELDGAVAGVVLWEGQVLQVHLCVQNVHLEIWWRKKNHTIIYAVRDVNNIKEKFLFHKQRPNRASSYILHNYHHFFMFSYQYWALCLKSDSHTCCWQAGKLLFPGRPVAWWQCGPALCCSCPATIPAPRVAAGCPPSAPPPDTGTRQSIHYCRHWEHLTTRCEKSCAARRERRTNKSSD